MVHGVPFPIGYICEIDHAQTRIQRAFVALKYIARTLGRSVLLHDMSSHIRSSSEWCCKPRFNDGSQNIRCSSGIWYWKMLSLLSDLKIQLKLACCRARSRYRLSASLTNKFVLLYSALLFVIYLTNIPDWERDPVHHLTTSTRRFPQIYPTGKRTPCTT